MFNTKKDRRVVEVTIEFNITAIGEWLKAGGKFEDIDKIKREKYGAWKDAVVQKYVIDMLPIGQTSNAYFHRNKGVISQDIGGIDFLENANNHIKHAAQEKAKINTIAWDLSHGCLRLFVNRNLVLLTPILTEVLELETTGKLSSPSTDIKADDVKIKVPLSVNDKNEFMEIFRGSNTWGVAYGNGLAHISFSTFHSEVEY